ncbi:MAG: Ig domain-containing protein, partial [Eubacteriales bacterium]|nr:Ig domain-containing protein [Eubacteriales bacterium]
MKSKRFLSILLCAALVFALLPAPALAIWDGSAAMPDGSGSQASPYQIKTPENLKWFADRVNSGATGLYADLEADITLNDTAGWQNWGSSAPDNVWTPIGSDAHRFSGVFDGKGHIVSGVYINNDAGDNLGLFGYMSSGSTIKNIKLAKSYIRGRSSVGGICGCLAYLSSLTGCESGAAVAGTAQYAGGIAGYVSSGVILRDCANYGTVTAGTYAGGIAGYLFNSAISKCINTGSVYSATASSLFGGICGSTDLGTITDCFNLGSVSTLGGNVGGICGNNNGTVTNVYNIGDVAGNANVGKVCGLTSGTGKLINGYFLGASASGGMGNNFGQGSPAYCSLEQLVSGEVAYRLGDSFGQTLGADLYPVFRSPTGSNAVYKLTYLSGGAEHAAQYYNPGYAVSSAGIALPTSDGNYFVEWEGLPAVMPAGDATVSALFSAGTSPYPSITTTSLPNGILNIPYSAQIGVESAASAAFSITAGALPGGLSLNGTTGEITGTPTAIGTYAFTVQADNGTAFASARELSIKVTQKQPKIMTASLPNGQAGVPYRAEIDVEGLAPFSFSLPSGALPAGLSLDVNTGVLSGTPMAAGSGTFTVRAQNADGTDDKELSVSISVEIIGKGTYNEPYQIWTAGQLIWFANRVNTVGGRIYGALKADVALNDMSDWENWGNVAPAYEWTSIGIDASHCFKGGFDGGGHTISGLYISSSGSNIGLFGQIGAATYVENITLAQSYIKGDEYVGGICGSLVSGSTIDNCRSVAVVSANKYVGGICGCTMTVNDAILHCQNDGIVAGNDRVGGIAGENAGMIGYCHNGGTVQGGASGRLIGGICGNSGGDVFNVYNTGGISGNLNVSGICGAIGGLSSQYAILENAYNRGAIAVSPNSAAICGVTNAYCSLSGCYYLNSSAASGIGHNVGPYTTEHKSVAQFASGEVAYLLGEAFGQTLGT